MTMKIPGPEQSAGLILTCVATSSKAAVRLIPQRNPGQKRRFTRGKTGFQWLSLDTPLLATDTRVLSFGVTVS